MALAAALIGAAGAAAWKASRTTAHQVVRRRQARALRDPHRRRPDPPTAHGSTETVTLGAIALAAIRIHIKHYESTT